MIKLLAIVGKDSEPNFLLDLQTLCEKAGILSLGAVSQFLVRVDLVDFASGRVKSSPKDGILILCFLIHYNKLRS